MHIKWILVASLAILLLSCKQSYHVTGIKGTIVAMDSTFDAHPHREMEALVQSYKTGLDREMNEVIGHSSQFMDYRRPESLLTNLTSDVMKAYGDAHLPTAPMWGDERFRPPCHPAKGGNHRGNTLRDLRFRQRHHLSGAERQ